MQFENNTAAGYCFANNPVIMAVKMGASEFPSGCTIRKCVITVTADGKEYPFETITYNGDVVEMDVRSAFSAWSQKNIPVPSEALSAEYTYKSLLTVSVKVESKYLAANAAQFTTNEGTLSRTFIVVPGGLSVERRRSEGKNMANDLIQRYQGTTYLNNRPTDKCVYAVGDNFVASNFDFDHTRMTTRKIKYTTEGKKGSLYIETNPNRQEIFFVNTFGVLETVSALCLESVGNTISGESYELNEKPTFVPEAGVININSVGARTWEMSSGYVPLAWAEFWVQEVMASPKWWWKKGEKIVPVTLESKSKEATLYDRKEEVGLASFEFKMKEV